MKKVVSFGEIMLRLGTPNQKRFIQSDSLTATFGGGESNITIALANYGIPTEFVTRLPNNDIGDWCISDLRKYNVETKHILRGGSRVGTYFLETGSVSRGSKVVYDRQHSAIAEIKPGMIDWKDVFKDAGWFHWTGILPAISQSAAEACLEAIQVANEMGLTVSTDLNFRDNIWKYGKSAREVMPALVGGCDIIVGVMLKNKEDEKKIFQPVNGNFNPTKIGEEIAFGEFEKASLEMKRDFPKAKKIILTLRGSINANHNTWGACMYADKLYQSKRYNLTHIVDRVGGGDSFVAGLIYGFLTYGNDDQKALEFATAASSFKHTIYGDFNIAGVEEIEKIMNGDVSGRLSV